VDRGDGHSLTSTYAYQGLAVDQTGRGEQGFESITITNPQQQTRTTQYAQGFPFTGMELGHTVTASTGVVLEQTSNLLATVNNTFNGSATAIYPYVQTSQQIQHNDLNNTPLPLSAHCIAPNGTGIDNYGNVTQSIDATPSAVITPGQACSTGAYTTTTVNQYNNMPSNPVYRIGELINSQVTKTSTATGLTAAQASITRTRQFDYYGTTGTQPTPYCPPVSVTPTAAGAEGLLKDEITECYPGGVTTALSVQTTYGRDSFGNVAATTQSWQDPLSNSAMYRTKTAVYEPQGRFPQTVTNALGVLSKPPKQDLLAEHERFCFGI
jgi:hypothetical protein